MEISYWPSYTWPGETRGFAGKLWDCVCWKDSISLVLFCNSVISVRCHPLCALLVHIVNPIPVTSFHSHSAPTVLPKHGGLLQRWHVGRERNFNVKSFIPVNLTWKRVSFFISNVIYSFSSLSFCTLTCVYHRERHGITYWEQELCNNSLDTHIRRTFFICGSLFLPLLGNLILKRGFKF